MRVNLTAISIPEENGLFFLKLYKNDVEKLIIENK